MKFENGLNNAFIVVSAGNTVVHENPDTGGLTPAPGPFGSPSNMLIQTDQSFQINVKFGVSGLLPSIIPGKWKCQVLLEKYGGSEASPGEYTSTVSSVPSTKHNYDIPVTIPAGLAPGVYKIAVVATFFTESGAPLPISGFEEIGPLNVYAG